MTYFNILQSVNQSIYFVTHNRIYKTKVTKTFTLCVTGSTESILTSILLHKEYKKNRQTSKLVKNSKAR